MPRFGRAYPLSLAIKNRIPPPVAAPVLAYDAIGGGANNTSAASLTWTHTVVTAGANVFAAATTKASQTVTGVTCGGAAMTLLGSIPLNNSTANGTVYVYQATGVAAGAQTLVATASAAGELVGNSVSYTGVSNVGTAQTAYVNTQSFSQATSGGGGGSITLNIFAVNGAFQSNPSITGYNATQRWTANNGSIGHIALLIGDSTTANQTFTASSSLSGTNYWGGLAVVLS